MIGAFVAHGPSVGIFWVVEPGSGEPRLLTAGCSPEAAEPYGDFLTFPDGHYKFGRVGGESKTRMQRCGRWYGPLSTRSGPEAGLCLTV
jgi:hypothetical protein